MNPFTALVVGSPERWLDELPGYQSSSIQFLFSSGKSAEEVAEAWLLSSTVDQTAPFGAMKNVRVYLNHVLNEIHDLLCSNQSREVQRSVVLENFKSGQTGLAAAVASVISPYLSSAPVFLTPVVTIILCGIAVVGLGAWCKMQSERRAASGSADVAN